MDSSVLFAGLHFDQKRFGTDVRRFNKRKGDNISIAECPTAAAKSESRTVAAPSSGNGHSVEEAERSSLPPGFLPGDDDHEAQGHVRKKKKTSGTSSPHVSGTDSWVAFNIFKTVPELALPEDVRLEVSDVQREAKSKAKLAEEVGVLRKRFRLHVAGQSVPPPLVEFEQLKSQYGCKKLLMRRVSEAGYKEPTPIQRQAIPILLERRECLACAPTGSGKTLAFMLPIAMNLKVSSSAGIRAVILCPIRELAAQTAREFKRLLPGKKLRVRVLSTSLFKTADFRKLPCDVLITTPLRLEHLLKEKKIDLRRVEYLVMDESDKLFEMGFVKQIDSIVAACSNPEVVRALFSATLPDSVEELARTIMHDAVRVIVGEKNTAASTVDQRLVFVGSEEGKLLAVRQLFEESLRPPVLLFVDSKERAKELHRELAFEDLKVDSIHADRSQEHRDAAVEKFREGKTWVLIATDLMARGMDFKGVNCVINYDFPQNISTYIHRIGRSGRAGRCGEAVTLYTEKDVPYLRSIAHVIRGAGCKVPEWMLGLRKVKVKKWKKVAGSKAAVA